MFSSALGNALPETAHDPVKNLLRNLPGDIDQLQNALLTRVRDHIKDLIRNLPHEKVDCLLSDAVGNAHRRNGQDLFHGVWHGHLGVLLACALDALMSMILSKIPFVVCGQGLRHLALGRYWPIQPLKLQP